jgi:hypothetical protein
MSNLKRYEKFEDIKAEKIAPVSKNIAKMEMDLKDVFAHLRSFKEKNKKHREIQPKPNAG